jgi:hypothetical protein
MSYTRPSFAERQKIYEKIINKRENVIRKKGGTIPKKLTRVKIMESWVKTNQIMAKKEPMAPNSPTFPDGLIKFEVKECPECQRVDIVQHQDVCVECCIENAYSNALIDEELKGMCGMCGKNLKPNEQNPCKRCSNDALGDTKEDRDENWKSVMEHVRSYKSGGD